MFRFIFGADIKEEDQMYKIAGGVTVLFIATYIAITILLFLNLFIALFNSNVSKIEENAAKYLLYQRAVECLNMEQFTIKCQILKFLTRSIYDFAFDEKLEFVNHNRVDSRISQIEIQMIEQMNILVHFRSTFL